MRPNPVQNSVTRAAVVAMVIVSVGMGALSAAPGPARGGTCPACVRDLAGNLIACNKPTPEVGQAAQQASQHDCCQKTAAAKSDAAKAGSSGKDSPRAPGPSRHKHDAHDCAGKCERCCTAPGQAPLVAPRFVVLLDPADSVGSLAVTHAAAPPVGVHVSVFHPPRA